MKCSNCSHKNDRLAQICEVCGTLLIEPATRTKEYDDTDYEQGTPRWGKVRFKDEMYLMVAVENTDKKFAFNFGDITKLELGRKDPVSNEAPPIDLSTCGGREKGVSRQHAMIFQDEGTLHVVDSQSANGTFLNGQKLAPQQPRVLRDGDELRLGHLIIRVSFLSEK